VPDDAEEADLPARPIDGVGHGIDAGGRRARSVCVQQRGDVDHGDASGGPVSILVWGAAHELVTYGLATGA
jgi:hypothetical protein